MRNLTPALAALVGLLGGGPVGAAIAAGPAPALVVCAPGYPGSTAEAQPSMDQFAAALTAAAKLSPPGLTAVYHEDEKAGVARLREPDAALALVPLPFFLEHREELQLDPLLQVVAKDGQADESWTLVARKGSVTSPAQLADFEILSLAAYSPAFVRGPALGGYASLPAATKLTMSMQVLSGLRKAASGAKIALLLDRAQAAALPTLPFAKDLEVVAKSKDLPAVLLCRVGRRLTDGQIQTLAAALPRLGETPAGVAALEALRLARFVEVHQAALATARRDFDAARSAAH